MSARKVSVCIILPVLNEEAVLRKAVDLLCEGVLSELRARGYEARCVIATNGSNVATCAEAQACARAYAGSVSVVDIKGRGRGRALRVVMKKISSDVYAYCDVDIPVEFADLINVIESVAHNEADIVVARRSGARPFLRRMMTTVFRWINRLFLNLSVHDAQCGVKAWNVSIAQSEAQECVEDGFFFDSELLARAKSNRRKIQEVSVHWIDQRFSERTSSVRPVRDSVRAVVAILAIAYRNVRNTPHVLPVFMLLCIACVAPWMYVRAHLQPYGFQVAHHLRSLDAAAAFYATVATILGYSSAIFVLWLWMRAGKNMQAARMLVVVIMLGIVLVTFSIHPTRSQDVYWNLALSRVETQHNTNPYTTTINMLPQDEWSNAVRDWRDLSMTHGPLWLGILRVATTLGHDLASALIILRVEYIVAYVAIAYMIWKIVHTVQKSEMQKTLLWAACVLNPLWIQLGLVDMHNDIFVALAMQIGLCAVIQKQYRLSIIALFFGGLIKYTPWLLISIPLLLALRERHTFKQFLRAYLPLCIACAAVAIGCIWHYTHFQTFPAGLQNELLSRVSPAYMLFGTYILRVTLNLPSVIIQTCVGIVVVCGVLFCVQKKKYALGWVLPYILIFVFLTPWFQSWYFLWIAPILFLLLPLQWTCIISGVLMLIPDFILPIHIHLIMLPCLCVAVFVRYLRSARIQTWLLKK